MIKDDKFPTLSPEVQEIDDKFKKMNLSEKEFYDKYYANVGDDGSDKIDNEQIKKNAAKV